MRIAVILNGISLSKAKFYKHVLPALSGHFHTEVFETRSRHDAVGLAAQTCRKRFDVVFAAGGDGTIHQVVNGLIQEAEADRGPALGIIPMGSGNDFARSLGISGSPAKILSALQIFRTATIDTGLLECAASPHDHEKTTERYFINVADLGMGPYVVKKVAESGRPFGSAIAYFSSIISAFFSYKPVELDAAGENWQWKSRARTFAVCNGRYFGNGLCIAPDAKPDDSVFEIFAVGNVSVADFILHSFDLRKGKKVKHDMVSYLTGSEVSVTSAVPAQVEADGEVCGWTPVRICVSARKVKVLMED